TTDAPREEHRRDERRDERETRQLEDAQLETAIWLRRDVDRSPQCRGEGRAVGGSQRMEERLIAIALIDGGDRYIERSEATHFLQHRVVDRESHADPCDRTRRENRNEHDLVRPR